MHGKILYVVMTALIACGCWGANVNSGMQARDTTVKSKSNAGYASAETKTTIKDKPKSRYRACMKKMQGMPASEASQDCKSYIRAGLPPDQTEKRSDREQVPYWYFFGSTFGSPYGYGGCGTPYGGMGY